MDRFMVHRKHCIIYPNATVECIRPRPTNLRVMCCARLAYYYNMAHRAAQSALETCHVGVDVDVPFHPMWIIFPLPLLLLRVKGLARKCMC